jgi:hypothetical protein
MPRRATGWESHEKLKRADQCQSRPRADEAVAQAVRQVGADRGHNASGQATQRHAWTRWFRRLASKATMLAAHMRPSTVNGSRRAVKPVSPCEATKLVGVLVADDRGHARHHEHGERGRDPKWAGRSPLQLGAERGHVRVAVAVAV